MLFLSVCNLKTNKLNRFEAMKKLGEEVAETYISLGVDSLQYAMMHRNEVFFDRDRLAKTFVNGVATPPETVNLIGTRGIYSTALDLCKFGQGFIENRIKVKQNDFSVILLFLGMFI